MELGSSSGLDDDTLYTEAYHIVTNSNLEKLSLTKVVKLLEDSFGVSLKSRIKFINKEITRIVQGMGTTTDRTYYYQTVRRPLRVRKRQAAQEEELAPVSAALAKFLGEAEGSKMSRPEALRRLWTYLKTENLHSSYDPHNIKSDTKLQTLFGAETKLTIFNITRELFKHLPVKRAKVSTVPTSLVSSPTSAKPQIETQSGKNVNRPESGNRLGMDIKLVTPAAAAVAATSPATTLSSVIASGLAPAISVNPA
eukprot:1274195-Amorphochlora_amoeboformis.AAC.2